MNKLIANFCINEVLSVLKRDNIAIEEFSKKVSPKNLSKLLLTIDNM